MHNKPTGPGPSRRPPRASELLLRLVSRSEERDGLLGDLSEEFAKRALLGEGAARHWYRRQVMRSLLPGLRRAPHARSSLPRGERALAMKALLQDLRYGTRALAQTPTFTVLAIATLALAIGVNSSIFSFLSAIFLSDIPIEETDRAAFVRTRNPARGLQRGDVSLPALLDLRDEVSAFEEIAGVSPSTGVVSGIAEPEEVQVGWSTTNLFRTWGVVPHIGRTFIDGEDLPGATSVAILSYTWWETRFERDPDVVGRVVQLDGRPTTIVGVAPKAVEFGDISLIKLWAPLTLDREASRALRTVWISARLAPGATLEQAGAQVAATNERLAREYPDTDRGFEIYVQSFEDGLADSSFWTVLFLLGVTVVLVMLIACSNIATMMLARGSARARELAVRAALGAGRGRILRQLLTESLVLALAAGALGVLVAQGALMGLTWIVGDSADASFFRMLEIDGPVLWFTLAVSLAAPLVFGFVPALRAARHDLVATLREGAHGTVGGALRGRRVLVGVQVSLALMLMIVAGLLIETMMQLRSIDFRYQPETILTARIDVPEARYPEAARQQAFRDAVMERVRALPGVERAAWSNHRLAADGMRTVSFAIEGAPEPAPQDVPWAWFTVATPDYLNLVDVGIVRGRIPGETDVPDSPPVLAINETTAQRFWPQDDPLGRTVSLDAGKGKRSYTVVGVVTDEVLPDTEQQTHPQMYLPATQNVDLLDAILIGSRAGGTELAAALRDAVWSVDAEQPVADIRTLAQINNDSMASLNAVIGLFAAFAVFALLMAAGGLYGVLSFVVTQQTREFGIRMALGARRAEVRSMVLRSSSRIVGVGIVFGLLGAFGLGRVLASGLSEVDANDPTIYALGALLLGAVALVSAWLPALRATRTDPMLALRAE